MENQFEFIAIEGVIGVGKTSLAKMLTERHGARLVLEQFEDNPFLPKFYEDRERYAFPTQMAFLASRFKQQQKMLSKDLFQQMTVSDYIFEKDRIFARLNLEDDELALYDSIFNIMAGIAATPDLIIYLQSSVDRLMENIRQRDRNYERHISRQYLQELSEAYNHFKTPGASLPDCDIAVLAAPAAARPRADDMPVPLLRRCRRRDQITCFHRKLHKRIKQIERIVHGDMLLRLCRLEIGDTEIGCIRHKALPPARNRAHNFPTSDKPQSTRAIPGRHPQNPHSAELRYRRFAAYRIAGYGWFVRHREYQSHTARSPRRAVLLSVPSYRHRCGCAAPRKS